MMQIKGDVVLNYDSGLSVQTEEGALVYHHLCLCIEEVYFVIDYVWKII